MKTSRTPALAIAIALLCTAQLAATGADETAADLTEVTLMLDWVPNANHVGIFVAELDGYFREHGLDVRIIQPGEVYAPGAVVGGRAQFGVSFQEEVTMLRDDGIPIVSIAAMLQTNTSGFAVRAGEGIDSPAEFAGLTYGTFNAPYEQPILDALVACAGGDPSEIEYVTAGNDLLAMLDSELADLVWIFYGTQGFQAQRLGIDLEYFPLNEYPECIPDYYTPLVIASESYLAENAEVARAFLAALSEAYTSVIDDPLAAAATLKEAVPELNLEELESSVPWLAERMVMDAPQWGHQERSVWADYGAFLRAGGVIANEFNADDAFDTRYLP